MFRRIMLLLTAATLVATMVVGSATSAAAQVPIDQCPTGPEPRANPDDPTQQGCVFFVGEGAQCPPGTVPVQTVPGLCFGSLVDGGGGGGEEPPPPEPTPLTKEACKNGGWEALGYRNQGQCVSAANHGVTVPTG